MGEIPTCSRASERENVARERENEFFSNAKSVTCRPRPVARPKHSYRLVTTRTRATRVTRSTRGTLATRATRSTHDTLAGGRGGGTP